MSGLHCLVLQHWSVSLQFEGKGEYVLRMQSLEDAVQRPWWSVLQTGTQSGHT